MSDIKQELLDLRKKVLDGYRPSPEEYKEILEKLIAQRVHGVAKSPKMAETIDLVALFADVKKKGE